jgi:hypothetical protein
MGKGFDSSCITPSFREAFSVRLVGERTIVILVPFIASLLLNALSLLASVFYPSVCISAADDIVQVSIIPITPSVGLL